ncbi:hypothetical protein [Methylobacterium radiotolerans]|uniref:Uncharacterized protein n=1 Tax=Methylobacterium radiotolerans (strain ATCC 27329 / DSM 1819 / JCM 2831 / NBRC 15690 / NCIMB 10815 / 0-1) TaxID=426355 RepID=B1MA69_METRJ|nr:hypothetical protein [Methylobacterium radiotolerans]ACB28394.1 hypothetical protein Mrad2831_6480 [Methylobacterium radiotolerans JCM 2831]
MNCVELQQALQCSKANGMTYGEMQAVVQLAVGLNVGLYALKELSLPYVLRQRKGLVSLRMALGEAKEIVATIADRIERENKTKDLSRISGRIMRVWRKSTNLQNELDKFLKFMNWCSGISAGISLCVLFYTAHNYGHEADNLIVAIVYLCYLTIPVGVLINLLARHRGGGLLQEQDSIYQDLSRII